MVDVVLLIVETAGLTALISWDDFEWQRGLLAACCIVKWFRVMYSLRGFELFGPRILPILSALKDTAAFLILMAFCLLGCTHAYYVLGRHDLPDWIYGAFVPVFRLGVPGDFELDELAGQNTNFRDENGIWAPQDPDPWVSPMYHYVLIWYFFVTLVINVLMMNILVGILGANYERYEEQSQVLFVRERARMIVIISARPWTRHVWKRWKGKWLYFTTKETPNTEDERSTRKAIQISTEEALKPLKEQIEQMQKHNEQMQKQNEQMKKQIEQMQKQNDSNFQQLLKALNTERIDSA